MRNRQIRFKVSIPSDDGFIGRSCKNPQCGRYFKIELDSLRDNMFCPYCGQQFSKEQMWTNDQESYFKAAATEQAKEVAYAEIDKMFSNMSRKIGRSKYASSRRKPMRYHAKPVYPRYQERSVDSEIICTKCQFPFQVYGIFGYCPGCGSENLRIYDANLEIIKQDVRNSVNKQRSLRHAYSDIVSTFEIVATARAAAITQDKNNFQSLYETRKFFKKRTGKDIFNSIDVSKIRQLQRLFQKRHVYEHNNGIISSRYVQKMPEDTHLQGQVAELSIEELEFAAETLRYVLDRLVDATI